jgi:hypothetical protein
MVGLSCCDSGWILDAGIFSTYDLDGIRQRPRKSISAADLPQPGHAGCDLPDIPQRTILLIEQQQFMGAGLCSFPFDHRNDRRWYQDGGTNEVRMLHSARNINAVSGEEQ